LSIESLFRRDAALPVVPKVVQHLIQSFRREDVAIDEIAQQIETDPVLSAKTLRLANSAYFHVSRCISTVDDALRMLGFVMVRNLVLGLGMVGTFRGVRGIDLPQFWRYSLHAASASNWLARRAGENPDLAFTIGLLHGLGHLVMHAAQPDAMRPIDEVCHPLAQQRAALERSRLGYHHCAVSAELALRWNFPLEITHALRAVVDPLAVDPPMPMAALVHVAAWRARVEALRWGPEQALETCPSDVARAVGLSIAWLPEQATLGATAVGLPAMPPLAELSQGLEAMLE
jgi:HD-like signal output (HDOD) protein